MEKILVCSNSRCRFVLDLRECDRVLRRSDLPIKECPECGSEWSSTCPFCARVLSLAWPHALPHCANCQRVLRPEHDALASDSPAEDHRVTVAAP